MSKKKAASSSAAALAAGFGFSGFGGVESLQAFNLSSEYQAAFKKLAKRDTTTKRKGLNELTSLFDSLTESSEQAVLSRWGQEFAKILEDGDVRVRIQALTAMEHLAKKVGRRLAPHLKTVLTPWLMAHFDTRNEVKQVARTTLRNCISEDKHVKSIIFCKNELLSDLQDRLQLTVQYFIGDDKSDEALLEANEKYERVISSAILTLSHIIASLPADENAKLENKYNEIMDAKFWSFFTSKHAPIRSAMYSLITTLTNSLPGLIEKQLTKLSGNLLAGFADKDPSTHAGLWEAVIHFLQKYPSTWQVCNFKQAILPKLSSLLANGGYGSATVTYTSVLPLLSLMPEELLFDSEIYNKILSSIWKGLKSEHLGADDSRVVVSSYMECALYCCIRLMKSGKDEAATKLLKEHYIPVLAAFFKYEKVLSPALPSSLATFFYKLSTKPDCAPLWKEIFREFEVIASRVLYFDGTETLQESDINQQQVTCKHIGAFLTALLAEAKSGQALPDELLTLLEKVFAGTDSACKNKHHPQLQLLVTLAPYQFQLQAPNKVVEYFDEHLGKWLPQSEQQYLDNTSVYNYTLRIAYSFFAHGFGFPGDWKQTINTKWASQLQTWAESNATSPLRLILQSRNTEELSAWRNSQLDKIAACVTSAAVKGDQSAAELLETLLSIQSILSDSVRVEIENTISLALRELTQAFVSSTQSAVDMSRGPTLMKLAKAISPISQPLLLLLLEANIMLSITDPVQFNSYRSSLHQHLKLNIKSTNEIITQVITPLSQYLLDVIVTHATPVEPLSQAISCLFEIINKDSIKELVAALLGDKQRWIDVRKQAIDNSSAIQTDWFALATFTPLDAGNIEYVERYARMLLLAKEIIKLATPEAVWYLNDKGDVQNSWLFVELIQALVLASYSAFPRESVYFQTLVTTFSKDNTLGSFLSSAPHLLSFCRTAIADRTSPLAVAAVNWMLTNADLSLKTPDIVDAMEKLFNEHFVQTKLTDVPLQAFEAVVPCIAPLLSKQPIHDFKRRALDLLYSSDLYSISIASSALVALVRCPGFKLENDDERKVLDSFLAIAKTVQSKLGSTTTSTDIQDVAALRAIGRFIEKVVLEQCELRLTEMQWESIMLLAETMLNSSVYHIRFGGITLWTTVVMSDQNIPKFASYSSRIFTALFEHLIQLKKIDRSLWTYLSELSIALRRMDTRTLLSLPYESLHEVMLYPYIGIQWTAYLLLRSALRAILPELARNYESVKSESDSEEVTHLPFLIANHTALLENEEVYTRPEFTLPTLLEWSLLLDYLDSDVSCLKLKADIGSYIRKTTCFNSFLNLLFDYILDDSDNSLDSTAILAEKMEQIWASFGPSRAKPPTAEAEDRLLVHLSAYLYRRVVELLPALVRSWWTETSNRLLKSKVEKFTMKFVSPSIIAKELRALAAYKDEACDYYKIKVSSVNNEVTASYQKDEVELNIILRIPASYPLSSIDVETGHKMGVKEATLRKWVLSMTALLLTRDGSVLDAVLLWKQYLDKHFEGVEVCPICYSLFQASNNSLPNLACKTCRNKFHSACLYKWFDQSHKNDCPLCRTPFN